MPPFAGDPVANRNASFEKIMLVVYYGMRQVIRMWRATWHLETEVAVTHCHITDKNDTYYLILPPEDNFGCTDT